MPARFIIEGLLDHAEAELDLAGVHDDDAGPAEYPGMRKAVLDVVKVFSDQGHSGGSASVALALVDLLLRQKPLTPLTGEDSEWFDRAELNGGEPLWQNVRHSCVFKDENRAWDIDTDRTQDVTFPYVVK